jgi:hypothetical protein
MPIKWIDVDKKMKYPIFQYKTSKLTYGITSVFGKSPKETIS